MYGSSTVTNSVLTHHWRRMKNSDVRLLSWYISSDVDDWHKEAKMLCQQYELFCIYKENTICSWKNLVRFWSKAKNYSKVCEMIIEICVELDAYFYERCFWLRIFCVHNIKLTFPLVLQVYAEVKKGDNQDLFVYSVQRCYATKDNDPSDDQTGDAKDTFFDNLCPKDETMDFAKNGGNFILPLHPT